jgi:hypothetical protein
VYWLRIHENPRVPKPTFVNGKRLVAQATRYISVSGTSAWEVTERLFEDESGSILIEKRRNGGCHVIVEFFEGEAPHSSREETLPQNSPHGCNAFDLDSGASPACDTFAGSPGGVSPAIVSEGAGSYPSALRRQEQWASHRT